MSFDNLPRAVAEFHAKIDTLTKMVEKLMSANTAPPLSEIMTVEDVSAMLCKSVSTIYAMTSEHRIPYRKQGNKLYFLRSEIQSWLMDAVVPKDTPKRRRKPQDDEISTDNERQPESNPDENLSENSATSTQIISENIDGNSPSRSVRTHRIPSKAGYIQEAERPSSPCFSQRNLKPPESGSSCRRHGITTATGAISAKAATSSTRNRRRKILQKG